jgi:hypothetical protein
MIFGKGVWLDKQGLDLEAKKLDHLTNKLFECLIAVENFSIDGIVGRRW